MTRKSFPLNFLHLIVPYICLLLVSIMKTLVYDGTNAEKDWRDFHPLHS